MRHNLLQIKEQAYLKREPQPRLLSIPNLDQFKQMSDKIHDYESIDHLKVFFGE